MLLALVVAVAENDVIGRDGDLPWRLSADLKRFRQLTMGHPIVMGRRTFESLGRVLPGRTSIVVSRQTELTLPAGAFHATSFEAALELAAVCEQTSSNPTAFVIGGAELYASALPKVQRIYLTRVHQSVAGDTYFPTVDWSQWQCVMQEPHPADEKNSLPFTFMIYERGPVDQCVVSRENILD